MKKYIQFLLLSLLWSIPAVWANDPDSLRLHPVPVPELVMAEQRDFPQVDRMIESTNFSVSSQESLFTAANLAAKFAVDSGTNVYREQAKADFEKLEKTNHYTDYLTPEDLNELPMGLSQKVGNTTIQIAVSNAMFYPGYAELTVYCKIIIPQAPYEIFFGVKGLKLSYTGGIVGDAKLVLLGDVPIPLDGGTSALVLKGGLDMKTGQAIDYTYVTIDCAGFKELGLTADIMFPRTMMVPLKTDGTRNPDPNKLVSATFKTVVSDWNDILVSVDLPAFEITPLNGIGFKIGKAVYDGSDIRNSPDVIYPDGYQAKYMAAGNEKLWRGVYIQTLEVTLPKQFSKGSSNTTRVSFGANNLLIDNNGISGSLFGRNILPTGSASGWRFSVDKFNIDLEANHLTGAGFDGTIQLPVSSTPLVYTAVISANDEYLLKIGTLKKLSFDVWVAKAELNANSWVQLKLAEGKFEPEANLNGRIGISTAGEANDSAKTPIVSFQGIEFTNLHLQTKAPFLTCTYFGYKDEAKLSNFPVTITELGLSATENAASLYFGVKVNLMSGSFGGETKVELAGKFAEKGDFQTWEFDKLKLNLISIHAKIGSAMTIDGALQILRDDPVYGNAISGSVKASMLNDKLKVEARAMFGSKDFRY